MPVINDLDIFGRVNSRAIPYDEFIEMNIKGGKVFVGVLLQLFFTILFRELKHRMQSRMESSK